MKYDKKEPETMDADPMRLLVSAILAFTVMLFINGFVGSMGGFPAFVAFTLVFFRIRTRAGMENGGMQQELSDRQITGRLLWKYAVGYLVLWGFFGICTADVEHIAFGKMGIFFCGDDHVCVCAFTVSACCNPGKGAVDSLCIG